MNLLEFFLTLQSQLKIWHWNTESFAEHKAFEDTYDTLSGLIDNYVEVHSGKNGRVKPEKNTFTFECGDYNSNVQKVVDAFIEGLASMKKDLNEKKDSDLNNILDEMIAAVNKLKYLLTLK